MIALGMIHYKAYAQQANNTHINVNELLTKKELSVSQIDTIIANFDNYEYVRDKEQREIVLRHIISESERLEYTKGLAQGKNMLGVLMRDIAKYTKAIELHKEAFDLAQNDTLTILYALNNLGVVYRRLDQPRIALDYHMQALSWAENYKSNSQVARRSICIALNSIGNINLVLNQPEQALKVFSETLLMEQNSNNNLGIAINYQNIGYAYEAMGQLQTAKTHYEKSLQYNNIIDSDLGRAICYSSIGDIHFKENNINNALKSYKRSMHYAKKTNDNYYIAQAHANVGKTYLRTKQFDKAIPELLMYQSIAESIQSYNLLQDSYRKLSEYYEATGNFKNALFLHKKAVQYNDSIINVKNSNYLNELQILYEADKKEQKIELLTIENKSRAQQNIMVILIAAIAFLVGSVLYILHKRKTDKQRIELETSLFRSLMNPHFLFNALTSIQSFLYKNESQKAAGYLGSFSKLTRSILKNSKKELITLDEELQTLNNYLEIEQMRLGSSFDFAIDVDPGVEVDFIYVLPTMLQPFVENSIHHGFKNLKSNKGLLTVKVRDFEKYVRISIEDNGCGIMQSKIQNTKMHNKSMGLDIFKKRIKLIENKYKKTVNFVIEDLCNKQINRTGTIVTIDFPHIEPND